MIAAGTTAQFHFAGRLIDAVAANAVKRSAAALQFKALVIAAVIVKPKAQKQQARD